MNMSWLSWLLTLRQDIQEYINCSRRNIVQTRIQLHEAAEKQESAACEGQNPFRREWFQEYTLLNIKPGAISCFSCVALCCVKWNNVCAFYWFLYASVHIDTCLMWDWLEQVFLSSFSLYPLLQSQVKEPGELTQICSQSCFPSAHRSMAETHTRH